MSDELRETVAAAQRGDRGALAALVAEHLPPLEAFVRGRAGNLIRDKESVHDLVQSVCREALADLSDIDYRGEREFRNWLFVLATRKILDRHKFYRRAQRDAAREQPLDRVDTERLLQAYGALATPSRIASAREELVRIEAAVARLPLAQREAVGYVKLLGLPYEQVAERMGRTPSSVRGLVARALAAIADELDG